MNTQDSTVPAKSPEDKPAKVGTGASARPFMASFMEHLIRNNVITADIAARAGALKQQNPGDRRTVLDILRDEFSVPRDVLQFQVAQFYAFRMIEPDDRSTRRLGANEIQKLMKSLPEQIRSLAMKQKVIPYDLAENQPDKLVVVTPNPSDRETSEVARAFLYKKFEICYMREKEWDEVWRKISAERQVLHAVPTMTEIVSEENEAELDAVLDREITRAQLITVIENIFADAVRLDASAIHFVPKTNRKTDVYLRIDGVLTQWYAIDDVRPEAVSVAVKIRTPGMDRYERMASQEGILQRLADGRVINFHTLSMPMAIREFAGKYEFVVVRIEREPSDSWKLETIGLSGPVLTALKETLAFRRGLILLTGPSRSGLTTTLAAMLHGITGPSISAVAVEEAMEFMFEGVCHVRLTPKMSYDDALRAVKRHDADVVILGAIKNREEADLALGLAMSGRRVFTTIHAPDTASSLARLHGFGIEHNMLAQSLVVVHAQRLVRKLCRHCRQLLEEGDSRVEHLGLALTGLSLYRPVGCVECVGGFSGVIPLHETLFVTPAVRSLIAGGGPPDGAVLRSMIAGQGLPTLRESAAQLLREGMTTVDEVWTSVP